MGSHLQIVRPAGPTIRSNLLKQLPPLNLTSLKRENVLTVVLENRENKMQLSFLIKKAGIWGSRNFTEAEVINFWEKKKGSSKVLSDSSKGFCRIIGSRTISPSATIGPHEEEKPHLLIRGWNLNLIITLEDPDFGLGVGWKPQEPITTWLVTM